MTDIKCGERAFLVTWSDHSVTELPFIWLRDNDSGELHAETRERVFDLTSVSLDIRPAGYELVNDGLLVRWNNKEEASVYSPTWLISHQPGSVREDPADVRQEWWSAKSLAEIPRFDASFCATSDDALYEALRAVKRFGLIIFAGLDDSESAGEEFGDLIGFKRHTNFGLMFEVLSKPEPVNLAYTSIALPLHTDLPNQSFVPAYQLLHSYRNSTQGGESIFADGFKICADLEKEDRRKVDLLMRVSVPWRFHDDSCDVRGRHPIISKNPDGEFDCLVFNAPLADIPDMEAETLYEFYAGYHGLMRRIRDPKYAVRHALEAGQMAMFDNRRVLHGRTAFEPSSGERHFRGYYIEDNEVDSRLRVMAREMAHNEQH